MSRPNTPPNWTAPFDAYEARYLDEQKHLAVAYIGVQDRGGDGAGSAAAARALLDGDDGPRIVEQGWSNDVAGAHTKILLAYWRDAEAFARWRGSKT
ncbi:MAG: hypothetical protein AAF337_05510, partial [Pseudomonadota bacterium]